MKMLVSKIKSNPDNPRIITEVQYQKLKKSIQEFPQMLSLVPLVIDEKKIVLSGNMRLKALKELGIQEVEVIHAKDLTEDQKREFTVKANLPYGEWDWDVMANTFDDVQLGDWGLNVPGIDSNTTVNFTASDAKGLRLKITFQNGEQLNKVVDLLQALGITEYKIK